MPPRLRLIHSPTPDWERMRAFYRDVLGLVETGGWDLPGDRGAFLELGGAEVEVMEQDVARLGIYPGAAPGWHPALEVEDLDAEHRRLALLGVPSDGGIRRHPWGTRDFIIRDPLGNPILIFQRES